MTARIEGVEYALKLSGAGGADVRVLRVVLKERLNAAMSLEIECIIPQLRKEPIQKICDQLIGGDAELKIMRHMLHEIEETVCGVVISAERPQSKYEFELLRAAGDTQRSDEAMDYRFVVHIAPAFELLKMHTWGNGSWHERTYPEVLKQVLEKGLGAYNRELEDKCKQKDKVDHIVWPPGESMYDFCRRLMQAGGIMSYFTHKGGKEKLILIDENGGFIDGTQYQPRDQPFRVDYTARHNVSENLNALLGSADCFPKKFEYHSFDQVETPPCEIVGCEQAQCGKTQSQVRMWGELRPTELADPEKQHKRAAELLQQREDTKRNAVIARSTILGMLPGRTYELELRPGEVRPYVVEQVHAEGIGAEYGTQEDYRNEVTLVPLKSEGGDTVDVRSVEPAEERRMPGITLAEIVAIENHPVEVDKIHRCRLKFLWDQLEGEDPTTWVSVLQPMAGLFGGTQWIPREGDRVAVAFHEGRPDRGLILGSLYDEQYKPPNMGPPDCSSVLPDSSLILGWNHSSIEPGKKPDEQGCLDRQTMLCMDVTANQEMFFFNAPFDWRRDVGNDSETNIKRDSTIKIDRHLEQKVKENQTEEVGKNYKQEVKENREEKVQKDYKLDVMGEQKITVTKKRTTRYMELNRTVTKGTTETLESGNRQTRVLSGNYRTSVGGQYTVVANNVSIGIGGGGGMGAATGAALDLQNNARLRGPQSVEIESGASELKVTPTNAVTQARVVEQRDEGGASTKIENGSVVVDAPRGVTFRCGASEIRLSPDGVYINGQLVSINATNTQIETDRFDISGE